MNQAARALAPDSPILPTLLADCAAAAGAARSLLDIARDRMATRVSTGGRISNSALEADQTAAHGLAWMATYVESLKEMLGWAQALDADGRLGEMESLILQIGFGEYLWQLYGGIPMSQGEMIRPQDLGLTQDDQRGLMIPEVVTLTQQGNTDSARRRLVALMIEQAGAATFGATGLDEEYEMIRDQFRRFADDKVVPHAHEWHLKDELIPMSIIEEMGELGVFGLTIPEEYGGFGMSKTAMCVVSEELSRGYIGVGSLGTRSEIAAELILCGGTEAQKAALAAEDRLGRDPAHRRLHRAQHRLRPRLPAHPRRPRRRRLHRHRQQDLDHPRRPHRRDDPAGAHRPRHRRSLAACRCSWPKRRREPTPTPFPAEGMTGGEIEVLGYRGMKEYELGFDGFKVKAENLLGGVEGQGFKQLMQTFESARIQTAARAIGVAQNALDIAMKYAQDRKQFGKALIEFPRVASKLAMMAVEIMIARQLTYFSAREKDAERRCDLEAGMAKLLGARVAWACADNGPADPRRQRLRAGIPDQPRALRRPHPQHLRGRRRDPGPGHRPPPAGTESRLNAALSDPRAAGLPAIRPSAPSTPRPASSRRRRASACPSPRAGAPLTLAHRSGGGCPCYHKAHRPAVAAPPDGQALARLVPDRFGDPRHQPRPRRSGAT